jgi:hypothetical protein
MSKSCRDLSQFGRLLRLYRQMATPKLPNLGEPGAGLKSGEID